MVKKAICNKCKKEFEGLTELQANRYLQMHKCKGK
jgi:hypothetical protein